MTRNGKLILVIEDDETVQSILKDALESEGFNTIFSDNGKDGLELAQNRLPHLILLDVMLPGMNGWEVCRRLKNNSMTRPIPILFLTARDQYEDMMEAISLEAAGYITKPFSVKELKQKIKKVLRMN